MKNVDTNSGERLSFFKLFSEKKYRVEIPLIQRDYAQGRASEKEVRTTFLDALQQYLKEGKPNRDLDFVYGTLSREDDTSCFVPLDGQQRLTTLFLLHWYLANISGQMGRLKQELYKNNKSQFSYETRTSSSEFCDALMSNDMDMTELINSDSGQANSLSKTIKDKGWFYLSWINDPTIQSMLTMLDAIHAKFFEHPEYFQLLIDSNSPIITFLFLNLEEFKLTDDLYIKMNARGKPLTDFENFKAKFQKELHAYTGKWPNYSLVFGDKSVSVEGDKYFIHKIDTDWADLFWCYRNIYTEGNTFDDELMNFIRIIIANYHLINVSGTSDKSATALDDIFETGGTLKKLSFHEYSELGCFSQGLFEYLIQMMDLLHHDGVAVNVIKPYLQSDKYYCEESSFRKVISNDTSYPDKLRFYAFYAFVANNQNEIDMQNWLRVIFNLTENRIFDSGELYRSALVSIDSLSKKRDSILTLLKNDKPISGFRSDQMLEEKIKSHLIDKSKVWESAILKAESHPFFLGQIGFILSFSGILEFYREFKHCNWSQAEDTDYFASFNKYATSSANVFSLIGEDSSVINYLWERAVLSKGEYFIPASNNRFNLLSSRSNKGNIVRDHSWKRLLRLSVPHDAKWAAKQAYVKAVFDDCYFDNNNIEESLSRICNRTLLEPKIEPWRKDFIRSPELYKECNQGFIYKNDSEFILLHQSQRNHYHSELNTKVIHLKLLQEQDNLKPFSELDYRGVKSGEESAFIEIKKWDYNKNNYSLEVRFTGGRFHIQLSNSELIDCHDDITSILDKHGYSNAVDTSIHINDSYKKREEVIDHIMLLCADLQGIIHE